MRFESGAPLADWELNPKAFSSCGASMGGQMGKKREKREFVPGSATAGNIRSRTLKAGIQSVS